MLASTSAIIARFGVFVDAAAIITRLRVLVDAAAAVAQIRAPVEAAAIVTPLSLASGREAHSAVAALAAATTGPTTALSECG